MLHEIAFMLKRKRAFEGYKKRSEFGFDKSKLTFFFKVFSWGICTINTKRAKRTRTLFFLLDKLVLFEKVILFCLFVFAPFLW